MSYKVGSRLFEPFTSIGYVTERLPLSFHFKEYALKQGLVYASVGKSYHCYNV